MKNAFFYFIFCPFIGFIQAIKNYRSSWAKPTIIAFVAFFGLSMVKNDTVDSSRYIQKLEVMHASNKSFENLQASFYDETDGQADIYVPLVTYLFSLFTVNGNLLFLFYGLVFGYFYANNIWLVLGESQGRLRWEQFLLLATFSMIIGFWDVNGVRMHTAAHVFFYGSFIYLYHNKKKGLLIAACSMLVHFSFILPFGLLVLYSLVRLNYRFLYFFYVASFFIAELNVPIIRTTLESYAPGFLLPKVTTYLSDGYIEVITDEYSNANWYAVYYLKILSYFNLIFVSILFFKAKLSLPSSKLLGFSLFFLAVANIASLLPSGSRFLAVALLFSIALLFIEVAKNSEPVLTKNVKKLSIILVFFCIVSIRILFNYFNLTTLTNPIVVAFTNINVPLIDLIK